MTSGYAPIDPEFKILWCAELRSGRFPQGRNYLQRDGKFCCMGVACELKSIPSRLHYEEADKIMSYDFRPAGYKNSSSNIGLPPNGWMGLAGEVISKLSFLNDLGKKSFIEIADWIEENL